jgi:peptidoglycan/xylan/chitin deacetylase (PgdA/CDA1 family)
MSIWSGLGGDPACTRFRAARRAAAVSCCLLFLAAPAGGAPPPPPVTHPDAADVPAGDPLDLRGAGVTQAGDRVTVTIQTAGAWTEHRLDEHRGRSLCVFLAEHGTDERLCLHGPDGHSGDRVRLARLSSVGEVTGDGPVTATVSRSADGALSITAALDALHLHAGALRWRVVATWRGGRTCAARGACADAAPDTGTFRDHLRTPAPNGCAASGPLFRRFGPPRHEVALTFDDGPDQSTPAMLDALEHAHAPATFFQIGRQIPGRAALLQRMLRDGDAIGDHTYNHPDLTRSPDVAGPEIERTAAAIGDATGGYRTCLFRAPYGAVDNALFGLVRGMGMTTIGWNVDPRDWSSPGTDAIVSRVLGAVTPGAIVILHDGGGPRGQTVAAVPRIVSGLRARGYRLVTVPGLLGFATTYG